LGWASVFGSKPNFLQDAVDFGIDLMVAEPQHDNSAVDQKPLSDLVTDLIGSAGMSSSIQLNR
jgi:hypothetical protein